MTKDLNGNKVVNLVSCGVSWIDLRTVFEPDSKFGRFWLGVCHYEDRVYMWTPLDYIRPLMVTSIEISPTEKYCEKAEECINFSCKLNRFNKQVFMSIFKDLGTETLGLPKNFGAEDFWFNDERNKFYSYWSKLLYIHNMKPEGGRLSFDDKKSNNKIITP